MASFDQRLIADMDLALGTNNIKHMYRKHMGEELTIRTRGRMIEWVNLFQDVNLWPNFKIAGNQLDYTNVAMGVDRNEFLEDGAEYGGRAYEGVLFSFGRQYMRGPVPQYPGVVGLEVALAKAMKRLGVLTPLVYSRVMRGEHLTAGEWVAEMGSVLSIVQSGEKPEIYSKISPEFLKVEINDLEVGFVPNMIGNMDSNSSVFLESVSHSLGQYTVKL